jgi:hypothetical protein
LLVMRSISRLNASGAGDSEPESLFAVASTSGKVSL